MVLSTANQAYVFLATVYGGVVIGLFFDIYRMVRRIFRPGKFITGIMDLIFWVIIALFSFFILFYINDGQVRFYSFLGIGLGWGLYILSISQFIMWIFDLIYKWVSKLLAWIFKIIKWPFVKIFQGINKVARTIKKNFRRKKASAGVTRDIN